ncbi:hypothetical protein BS78_01G097200 [Paspalum vaginatum]|nr:hypothetical protein BS78_01G097200 [Paspalum vaginatum]
MPPVPLPLDPGQPPPLPSSVDFSSKSTKIPTQSFEPDSDQVSPCLDPSFGGLDSSPRCSPCSSPKSVSPSPPAVVLAPAGTPAFVGASPCFPSVVHCECLCPLLGGRPPFFPARRSSGRTKTLRWALDHEDDCNSDVSGAASPASYLDVVRRVASPQLETHPKLCSVMVRATPFRGASRDGRPGRGPHGHGTSRRRRRRRRHRRLHCQSRVHRVDSGCFSDGCHILVHQ